MFMHRLLFLSSVVLICFSCSSNSGDSVDIPQDMTLDLDQDGSIDFRIVYNRRTEGDPIGNYEAVRMNLVSSDTDQVLKNRNQSVVFLNDVSQIANEVSEPLIWEVTNPSDNISSPLATIRTDYEGVIWNDEWTVFSFEKKETYLVGFKLQNGSTSQIGYIEFSIDLLTGEFVLLETRLL